MSVAQRTNNPLPFKTGEIRDPINNPHGWYKGVFSWDWFFTGTILKGLFPPFSLSFGVFFVPKVCLKKGQQVKPKIWGYLGLVFCCKGAFLKEKLPSPNFPGCKGGWLQKETSENGFTTMPSPIVTIPKRSPAELPGCYHELWNPSGWCVGILILWHVNYYNLQITGKLGGGNSNILECSSLFGTDSQFDDHIFQRGWNHQLG